MDAATWLALIFNVGVFAASFYSVVDTPPSERGFAGIFFTLLFTAMLAHYKLGVPLWLAFLSYCVLFVATVWLAFRIRRARTPRRSVRFD